MLDKVLEESTTYQATIRKGMVRGIRATLLDVGRIRFGEPTREVESALQAVNDPDRLLRLGVAMLSVATWDEMLATP